LFRANISSISPPITAPDKAYSIPGPRRKLTRLCITRTRGGAGVVDADSVTAGSAVAVGVGVDSAVLVADGSATAVATPSPPELPLLAGRVGDGGSSVGSGVSDAGGSGNPPASDWLIMVFARTGVDPAKAAPRFARPRMATAPTVRSRAKIRTGKSQAIGRRFEVAARSPTAPGRASSAASAPSSAAAKASIVW